MTKTLEILPLGHGNWGVWHNGKDTFIAAYKTEIEAYRFAFGYLNERLDHLRAKAIGENTHLQSTR